MQQAALADARSRSLAVPGEPFLEADLLAEPLTQQVQALLDLGADRPVAMAAIAVLVDGRRLIAAYAHPGVDVPPAVRVREERHRRSPPPCGYEPLVNTGLRVRLLIGCCRCCRGSDLARQGGEQIARGEIPARVVRRWLIRERDERVFERLCSGPGRHDGR